MQLYITIRVQVAVNASDELPLYRQIMRQIVDAIAGGKLEPGEKLKSHRELSEQLVIAPLTVKKAYDELEALGYIETHRGRGTFVCAKLPRTSRNERRERVRHAARELLSQSYLAGMTYAEVVNLLRETSQELTGKKEP